MTSEKFWCRKRASSKRRDILWFLDCWKATILFIGFIFCFSLLKPIFETVEAYCKGSYMSQHLVHIVKFESHAQMSGRLQNKQNVNTGFCISLVISNFFFYLKPVVPYQAARGRRSPRRLPWRTWGWTRAAGSSGGPWHRTGRTRPWRCCGPSTSPASSTWRVGSGTTPGGTTWLAD